MLIERGVASSELGDDGRLMAGEVAGEPKVDIGRQRIIDPLHVTVARRFLPTSLLHLPNRGEVGLAESGDAMWGGLPPEEGGGDNGVG